MDELGVNWFRLLQVELLVLVVYSTRGLLDRSLLENLRWQWRRDVTLVVLSGVKFRLHKLVLLLVLQLLVSEVELLLLDLLLSFELFLLVIIFEVIKKPSGRFVVEENLKHLGTDLRV